MLSLVLEICLSPRAASFPNSFAARELRDQLEYRKRNKLETWSDVEQTAPKQEGHWHQHCHVLPLESCAQHVEMAGSVEDDQEEGPSDALEVEEPEEAKEETVDWFESFKEEDEEEEEEKEKKRPKS